MKISSYSLPNDENSRFEKCLDCLPNAENKVCKMQAENGASVGRNLLFLLHPTKEYLVLVTVTQTKVISSCYLAKLAKN